MKKESGSSFVVHSARLDFKSGASHGDLLVVKSTYVIESAFRVIFTQSVLRRKKVGVEAEGAGDELLVKGKVVLVCVNEQSKLVALPAVILDAVANSDPI